MGVIDGVCSLDSQLRLALVKDGLSGPPKAWSLKVWGGKGGSHNGSKESGVGLSSNVPSSVRVDMESTTMFMGTSYAIFIEATSGGIDGVGQSLLLL